MVGDHPQSPRAGAEAGVAAPADEGADQPAGDVMRRIAEIALDAPSRREAAERLAPLLAQAIGAAAVTIFAVEKAPVSGPTRLTRLRPLGKFPLPAAQLAEPPWDGATLKRAALRAVAGVNGARAVSAPHAGDARVAAAALGQPNPWAVAVARWEGHPAARFPDRIEALAPALALALRPSNPTAPTPAPVPSLPHVPEQAPAATKQDGRCATTFTLSSDAILTIGDDYVVREANPASAAILGWPQAANLAGQRCLDMLRCHDARKLLLCDTPRCPLREAFSSEAPAPPRDLRWETRSRRLCEVSASFTAHGVVATSGRCVVVVARDVTALNAANRARADFLSMVSHELRTPLNSINGFLDIVLDGHTGPLTSKQREFLTYAHVSAQHLTTLVEDVLLLSKADAGQFLLRLGTVDVAQLAAGAIQIAEQAAAKAQITLRVEGVDDVPTVYGDDLRLSQVLNNLLSNAIKFSAAGASVTLRACHRGDEVEIAVADAGCGLTHDDQARIFERFYQGERTPRRAGSYGLGLAIAKLLVEQHRGRIWVESEPDAGATFRFTVPVAANMQG